MPMIASDASNPATYGSTVGAFSSTAGSTATSSSALLSGSQAASIGSAVGSFGSAISDFMSIGTDQQSAAAYGQAAALAGENIQITQTATNVQVEQAQRQLATVLGQQQAAEAGNGFAVGTGSGRSIAAASAEQGALAQSLITSQGAVQENAYKAQQTADLAMQAQAKAKAGADLFGGIASTISGIASVAALV